MNGVGGNVQILETWNFLYFTLRISKQVYEFDSKVAHFDMIPRNQISNPGGFLSLYCLLDGVVNIYFGFTVVEIT